MSIPQGKAHGRLKNPWSNKHKLNQSLAENATIAQSTESSQSRAVLIRASAYGSVCVCACPACVSWMLPWHGSWRLRGTLAPSLKLSLTESQSLRVPSSDQNAATNRSSALLIRSFHQVSRPLPSLSSSSLTGISHHQPPPLYPINFCFLLAAH